MQKSQSQPCLFQIYPSRNYGKMCKPVVKGGCGYPQTNRVRLTLQFLFSETIIGSFHQCTTNGPCDCTSNGRVHERVYTNGIVNKISKKIQNKTQWGKKNSYKAKVAYTWLSTAPTKKGSPAAGTLPRYCCGIFIPLKYSQRLQLKMRWPLVG